MRKVLIVEDDQLVATAYKKRFREAGYDVEWAPDGIEGIKMVGALKPDVVLLDLLMPRLDGIEVLKYIRSHPELKNLPVVVFSNSYMTNLVENAWRAGADQCLMKASTTPAQLFDAVNKAIQKAAARTSAPQAPAAIAVVTPLARPAGGPASGPAPAAPAAVPSAPRSPAPATTPPVVPLPSRAPAAPSFVSSSTAPGAAQTERGTSPPVPDVDPEFQAQIRQLFVSNAPAKLAAVRDAANAFVQDQGSSMQLPLLGDLFRKVHSLTGNAAVAGCSQIADYASTFEALLQELQQKPKFINISTARTVNKSVEFLEWLFQIALESEAGPPQPAKVLVVDANAMSSQAIGMALETAGYQPAIAADAAQALGMLATGGFAAAVIMVNLPSMNGFELFAQIQALPLEGRLPVLFVSSLSDFQAHSNPELLGENDIIATPFLLIELTLKAVTQVEGARLQKLQAAA